jgi:hypothetical protein
MIGIKQQNRPGLLAEEVGTVLYLLDIGDHESRLMIISCQVFVVMGAFRLTHFVDSVCSI